MTKHIFAKVSPSNNNYSFERLRIEQAFQLTFVSLCHLWENPGERLSQWRPTNPVPQWRRQGCARSDGTSSKQSMVVAAALHHNTHLPKSEKVVEKEHHEALLRKKRARTACNGISLPVTSSMHVTSCPSSSISANIACFSRSRLPRPFFIDLHNFS